MSIVLPDPTPATLSRLRRMTAEPTETLYTDEDLRLLLQEFPTAQKVGQNAWVANSSLVNVTVWDIHAAAARIWEEKVASLIGQGSYDIDADGQTLHRDQKLQQYRTQLAYHTARRRVRSVKIVAFPSRAQRTLEQRIEEENTEW
jgi:hypothetical protein